MLTREEEEILSGKHGEAKAKALEVIIRVAESLDAKRLVRIKHAHISGVSYGTIGEPGLAFIKELSSLGAKVSVPSSLNPIGFDESNPFDQEVLYITQDFYRGQMEILENLKKMGIDLLLTCTPYYTTIFRKYGLRSGDHVAWGESSAVAYANSFLGLRTNREGGPLALMAAIAGRTYYYGMHIRENRVPRVKYVVDLNDLGYNEVTLSLVAEYIASIHEDESPPLLHLDPRNINETIKREIAATLGAAGNIAMIAIPGITKEAEQADIRKTIRIKNNIIIARYKELAQDQGIDPDYYFIGCPHTSEEELEILSKIKSGDKLIVTLSRDVYSRRKDLVQKLVDKGATVLRSTCLIVSNLRSKNIMIATNSYKAYFYLTRKGINVSLIDIKSMIERLGG
ncbi:MAG: aconitase X catalytic domain-containing protein [Desulfurococcales archaeon]|nr:aconitase X catalytic domain-containing protein [Desulfurococcales archaeon]